MKNHAIVVATVLILVFSFGGARAFAQGNADAVDAHMAAARDAAGFDFTGTLA